jgi:FMN-dependent NADH-azoreductase
MHILQINSSPRANESRSLAVANHFVSVVERKQAAKIDRIDLFHDPLPEFGPLATAAKMALFTGQQQSAEQVAIWSEIRGVFDRFAAADLIVINTPMWNNGIPYKFKQYIDVVTQPGWAFGFDPSTGYAPLLSGKKAVVVQASGVWFEGIQPNFGSDFATPCITDWLKFVGIDVFGHIRFQPTVLNADVPGTERAALKQANQLAEKLIAMRS